ncbi:putative metal cation transporting p-type ATPase [Mycobacterium ulcerans str. Harvey]|uniref:Metal cation transporting p-type ATPase n=1 Tax=Mycobacterium ulcerans str. Harvey TaxID=1299332 RepID=A0ABP3AHU2_MYCUL|nr:putative metal cation transporting p-type ATPase [Mycobacterium ulcerans str. Harvey]
MADGQRDRHPAPGGDGRADRFGRHATHADRGRLARPAGGADHGRVLRGARGGGDHPGLSHLFGCTPVGPLAWGQALLAAAVAGSASVIAPELLMRVSRQAQRLISVTADGQATVQEREAGAPT